MTINALNVANSVLIPVQPQFFSTKGLELLFSTIEQIKRELNPNLEIAGALVTMYDGRIKFHREVVSVTEATYSDYFKVFRTKIPVSIKTTESQALSVSIFEHDPTGKIAESYRRFTRELLSEA
jgi:chromosome partitioning protein